MKCGTPVSVNPQTTTTSKQMEADVCKNCGNPLKPGQKFCMKCGTPVNSNSKRPEQAAQKGWFTDGVRAVANAVTGGALNRDIAREQQQAVRQQAREDQGQIDQAQQGQQAAERAQRSAEEEAERARDRRNQEAIDGIDVVRGRAIWNIQPGQVARRVTETEFNEIENMKGVIIQEGCSALVYVDGELVGMLSGGAYTFPVKSEAEKKAEREEAERKLNDEERKKKESFMDRGLFGTIGIGLNTVRRFFFGNKKGENEQKRQARKEKVEKMLKAKAQPKLIRVYLVSDRVLTLTFGGQQNADGGINYVPFTVPTKLVDVEIGVSLQMQVSNINDFLRNYLADQASVTTNQLQQMLTPTVQNLVTQMLRNLDYQQEGLPEPVIANLSNRIQSAINQQMYGIQCTRVLQITDRSANFERFRAVERELFCSEKELGYLQRTGEFRNRLAAETNKQEIDKATSEEELRYALQQINRDQLLHDDEMEQFVLMLNAQKRLREAKSQEEEYEALIDIKKSRLVKDDEMAALEDALAHNKIERESVTEIMRIQHQQSVDDARLHAQWALDDLKQDHDWEREDLQRRRNWGIEDEQREREWMHEEQEREREWTRDEQEYNRRFNRTQQQDEYDWQKRLRETDFDWQQEERRREANWQQRQREEQIRREDEQIAFERQRQDKFDDIDILDRKASIAQRNMQAMKEAELRELQEQNRSTETIHSMDVDVEKSRIDAESRMTQEQIAAAHMKDIAGLDAAAQAEMAKMMGSGNTVKAEMAEQQKNEMKEMYEKMMAMQQQNQTGQQQQANMNQQQMMQMMQMMMQGMTQMGAAQVAGVQNMNQQQMDFMQQRFQDQQQRANEYRQDAQRQQDRMDHTLDQSLNYTTRAHQTDSQSFAQAMGGAPQGFQQMPPQQGYQQSVQPQNQQIPPQQRYPQPMQQPNQQPQVPVEPATPQVRHCPACGAEVPEGEMFCGECGNRM